MHLLNCVVKFTNKDSDSGSKCDKDASKSEYISVARRLTSDMYPSIISNYYFKPSYKCPYYYITNHDSEITEVEINDVLSDIMYHCGYGTDLEGNVVKNELEIRCGSTKRFVPTVAYVDYLKMPSPISMNYEDLDSEDDNTQVLEFPEYVCYEIQNELVKLVLENIADPRLQTNIPINQTVMETSINNSKN